MTPQPQKRICLKCRKKFKSESIGNRLCAECTLVNSRCRVGGKRAKSTPIRRGGLNSNE